MRNEVIIHKLLGYTEKILEYCRNFTARLSVWKGLPHSEFVSSNSTKGKKNCHCEPVTDVTGVAIPQLFECVSVRISIQPGDSNASVRTGSE